MRRTAHLNVSSTPWQGDAATDDLLMTPRDLKQILRPRRAASHLGRFASAEIQTDDLAFPRLPVLAPGAMRLLSPRRVAYVDGRGGEHRVSLSAQLRAVGALLRDLWQRPRVHRDLAAWLDRIEDRPDGARLDPARGGPLYVRSDLIFHLTAGGSVGHIAGVLNNLGAFGPDPTFVTTSVIPTVDDAISTVVLRPEARYWDFRAMPRHFFNLSLLQGARPVVAEVRPGWIYHRYSLGSFAAAALAQEAGVPLVLEYNGSEIWIEEQWGQGAHIDPLDVRIEEAVLRAAALIVVVSDPLRVELVERGISGDRILVNPNGVDSVRYRPDIDGSAVRKRLGLTDERVIGFIGTFGPWHGASVLAEAFGRLLARDASLGDVRLLLIGDGAEMGQVRTTLERSGAASQAILTGTIPQAEGPEHLAACDILVAPHVPNADGSAFFGSPTKVFEYMAMGRPIVASDLDQIGEVLDHDATAWMVEPGSVDALCDGLTTILSDPDRLARLGPAARAVVEQRHTWRAHTGRIVEALHERCG